MNGDHNPVSRELLQGSFQNGDRPNSDDFARVFASFLNLTDEDIHIDGTPGDANIGIGQENPEQRLDINGAVRIGFSDEDVSGSIRWSQTDGRFEFNDGGGWQALNLSGGGGGSTPWTGGPDITYDGGNVGIGTVPVTSLHIDGGTNVNFNDTSSGFVIIGDPTANHLAMDANEIMARDANTLNVDILRLQNQGGSVRIGQSAGANDVDLRVFGDALKSGSLTWGPVSDRRLKKNIKPFNEGLETILKINPVKFKYNGKAGMPTKKEYIGLIAQDLGEVCPDLILPFLAKGKEKDTEETEFFTYNADGIIFLMLNAIKELAAKVDTLESELTSLKDKQ
ncbi:tail fiber domain-containing protein [Maribacter sp. 2307UL18-2]|uniref:tail fiber domain-containing protein n=1 Tax=Maribacter sp. 2307UL18-2 TaxID=3386274 RepID=UPI0039BCFCAE